MSNEAVKDEPVVTSSEQDAVPEATPVTEPTTPQKPTEPEAGSADGEQAPEPQTPEDDDALPPLPKGVQRKINRLTRKAKDAERTAHERELELQLAHERLKQYEPARPTQPEPEKGGEPTLEQFDYDYTAYAKAVSDWNFDKRMTERDQHEANAKRQKQVQERMQSIAAQEAAFMAGHPDYEDIAKDPTLPISEVMAEAMRDSDDAPAIAYYLGNHREEAAQIAQMSPAAAGRAIGRIESKLSAPSSEPGQPPRRVTQAPPPVTTLNSGAPISKSLEDIKDMGEYAAERKRQRTAKGIG